MVRGRPRGLARRRGLPPPATAQLQFSSADGKQSFKIGILGQLQAESIENGNAKDDSANNLFLRRLRLLGNFKLSDQLTVFFDTDSPNLGKGNPDGTKNNADIFIQDFVVTYAFRKEFQLDGGMLLMAQSYNHNQSAATLLALDYGPYTFVESVPTTSRTGRDYGLQARGYLGGDHLEYRAGVFQGVRGVNNTNSFRYAGRLAYYVFGPETTYFYRGTSLGKTQTLSIGGSFDRQEDYKSVGADCSGTSRSPAATASPCRPITTRSTATSSSPPSPSSGTRWSRSATTSTRSS